MRDSALPGGRGYPRAGLVTSLLAAAVLLAAALAGGTAIGRAAVSSTLYANFDADGNISLKFADGTPIGQPTAPGTVVPAGTYTVLLNNNSLDDLGNPHQFHLFGPGVNLQAGQSVQVTWTATFLPSSTYVFQDDLNPTTEHEVFGTPGSGATSTTAVAPGAAPAPVTATSTPTGSRTTTTTSASAIGAPLAPGSFRGNLTAAVTAGGELSLTSGGHAVTTLVAGRYTVTLHDSSRASGFTLQEVRQNARSLSGAAFTGTKTLTLNLTAGQWFFYSSLLGRKRSFRVSA